MNVISGYAQAYRDARIKHDEAVAAEAEAKTRMESAERVLIQAMIDAEMDTATIDGVKYTPKRTTKYSCLAEDREELLSRLEADGYRGLFTVNPATLSSLMNELSESTVDGEIPTRYADIVRGYDQVKLSVSGLRKGR